MEHNIELASGDKIKIPENCIAKIEGAMVIIEEKKTKFKKGDFIYTSADFICIVNEIKNNGAIEFMCYFYVTGKKLCVKKDIGVGYEDNARLATPQEKQLLLDKLHEKRKDLDEKNLELVNYVWKPKKGDIIWYITSTEETVKMFVSETDYKLRSTEFRTKELAEAALEALKKLKHY